MSAWEPPPVTAEDYYWFLHRWPEALMRYAPAKKAEEALPPPPELVKVKVEREQEAWDRAWKKFGDPNKVMSDPTAIFAKHFAQSLESPPKNSAPTSAYGRGRQSIGQQKRIAQRAPGSSLLPSRKAGA